MLNVKKSFWRELCLYSTILAVLAIGFSWFSDNYAFGRDAQLEKCVKGAGNWFFVYRNENQPVKGELMVYRAEGLEPVYPAGQQMVKYLAAVPGDHVKVAKDGVYINGERFTEHGPELAYLMERTPSDFYGERTLNENEYWMLGNTRASFDSRYFGAISRDQIVARASIL